MKLISLVALYIPFCSFAAESQVDLRIDTDPNNLQGKSSFNLTTTTALQTEFSDHAIILTPEMSFYTNGGIDFSVTTGHRHRWKNWVLGHHIFFDRTNADLFYLDQIGTGVDLQTSRFDFRLNYYHPVTDFGLSPIRASKWADSEIFFKTQYFGVGTGPLYNIDTQTWALHSRILIPLKDMTLNFGALCGSGNYGLSQALFSISFHLFKLKKLDALISPPCHVQKSNIYYNSGYSYSMASDIDIFSGNVKLDYNPQLVSYIDQSEDDITFIDKTIQDKK